ncbi:membrane protein [Oxalicibacterium flavum]|uniref:Membrane protein n=1 Tax=Oxalicibacterium flavum TaxID=179467 RepID=A0A8J2UKS8_9BURK|nr:TPM domain-containing protein [Oxalicibacterium flavum]GGB97723.1 membrane protein [Oxalicibacterium flavum]
MNKFSRALRHLTSTRFSGRKAFPCEALRAIQHAIEAGEARHRAEIRLIVEAGLSFSDIVAGIGARDRAHELFSQYRIWDTEENSGILIYIDLADHQVEIVADRGVTRLISEQQWQSVCRAMTEGFARGDYRDGVIAGLRQLNDLLQACLPEGDPQPDQLSNKPILL